jgi:hypothetical protein
MDPTLILNNGVRIPALGLGVYQRPPEETVAAVRTALEGDTIDPNQMDFLSFGLESLKPDRAITNSRGGPVRPAAAMRVGDDARADESEKPSSQSLLSAPTDLASVRAARHRLPVAVPGDGPAARGAVRA